MPAPTDRNALIALAKGWTWDEKPWFRTKPGAIPHYDRWLGEDLIEKEITHWLNPEGDPAMRPDYVGTLEGLSGMLWELGPEWTLHPDPPDDWLLWRDEFEGGVAQTFRSPRGKLGDCVGDAYLFVKETGEE